MVVRNEGGRQAVVGMAGNGPLPGWSRTRLATELFNGRFRPSQSVRLHEIAVEFALDDEAVLRAFAEFQELGMVTLSEDSSAIVRSPDPEETKEAYEIRAATEEIAGRTAASVLKGYTGQLRDELAAMRRAVARGDLDAFAEHDVRFHRDILKASQNDVLLRVWDALALDLRIRVGLGKVWKDLPAVVESHQPIVDALEKGCGREAGLLLRNHVETVLERLRTDEWGSEGDQEPRGNLAQVDGYAAERRLVRTYRGGLCPARLRRVAQFVQERIEDELSLDDMAESVGLSTAHFAHMFRKSTGESPHQFVLRHRVERAKEMLRATEARVLDVAVACGFKTQQHFARVFRRMCGASPTEYRQEFLGRRGTGG